MQWFFTINIFIATNDILNDNIFAIIDISFNLYEWWAQNLSPHFLGY